MSTPVSGERGQPAASSCARRSSVQPVVPTTAWMPCRTQKSRLPITEAGVVSSTATWAPASASGLQLVAPAERRRPAPCPRRPRRPRTASAPIRPLAPRTATRSLLIVFASLPMHRDGLARPRSCSRAACLSLSGPMTDSEGRCPRMSRATARTSSGVTDAIRASMSSTDICSPQHSSLLPIRFISAPVSSRPRTVEPRSWPMARPISSSREAVLGDLVELVAADLQHVVDLARAGSPRRRRTGRSRRSPRCTSRRCRPGRASPGPPGRGGSDMPPPRAVFSTPRAQRRSSVRARPGMPRTTWACSVLRPRSSTRPAVRRARRPSRGAIGVGAALLEGAGLLEGGADLAYDLVVVDVAGGRDDEVGRVVVLLVEAADAVGG